jgi:hypothetical protein
VSVGLGHPVNTNAETNSADISSAAPLNENLFLDILCSLSEKEFLGKIPCINEDGIRFFLKAQSSKPGK